MAILFIHQKAIVVFIVITFIPSCAFQFCETNVQSKFQRRSNFHYKHNTYKQTLTLSRQALNNSNDDIDKAIPLPIENQTLLSVEVCIDLHRKNCMPSNNKRGNVIFVDASWWHKGDLDGRKMFEEGPRIKGAVFMDIDDISSQYDLFPSLNPKNLPHMMPPMDLFSAFMDAYEISNDDHIIIYGRESVFFTPRIWFMLKSFGHNPARLHLMQGSYEEWVQKGGEIETEEKRVDEPKDIFKKIEQSTSQFQYKARVNPSYIFSMNDVSNNLDSEEENKSIIVDSRGSSYVKGNIPNSIHIPYKTLVDSNNSLKLKSKDELLAIFDDAGIDPLISRTIICTCGTGVSACSVFLALVQCGRDVDNGSTFMYDGSWSEWGKESATPKERSKLK